MPDVKPLQSPSAILLWDRKLREKKAVPVTEFNGKLAELFGRLKSTCYAYKAVGLAAPQICEFVRVALIHYPQEKTPWMLINPVIDEINSKGEQVAYEACLSIPTARKINVQVRRCNQIFYTYQDLDGKKIEAEADGMLARVIAHEVDHLDGWFYIDRIGDLSRSLVLRSHKKYIEANPQLKSLYQRASLVNNV